MDANIHTDSQEILSKVRTFIAGATRPTDINTIILVKTAVSLLKTLPAAREAVLEYFSSVFQNYVSKYLSLLDKGTLTLPTSSDNDTLVEDEISLVEIHDVLGDFVKRYPEAWAPIVSTWSLELLGAISSRQINNQIRLTLNDRLQIWTACGAIRNLLDINTQCMSCLMYSNTDACINSLLEMSVLHAHFDWVVVHVGSSFPETVINKVLTCGLKDFRENDSVDQNPKLGSVVGILGYLANTHFTEIKNALTNLFRWSLEEADDDKAILMLKVATVPYLLHLACMSPMLLKALSVDTLQSLDLNVLMRLSKIANDWCPFAKDRQGLLDLVIRLLLCLEDGVYYMLTMLFETASINDSELSSVSNTAQEIVELLINAMDVALRSSEVVPPLIRTFYNHMPVLKHLLLSSDNSLKSTYATRLFIVLGKYNTELLSSCIVFLLNRATTEVQIERLLEITRSLNDTQFFAYAFSLALQCEELETVIDEDVNCSLILWKNVRTLLQYEIQKNCMVKSVLHGLVDNFRKILDSLKEHHCDPIQSRIIVSVIFSLVDKMTRPLTVEEIMNLTEGIVLFFYSCMVCENDPLILMKNCDTVNMLLHKCSLSNNITRNQATRILIETALFPPVSPIFGAVVKPNPNAVLLDDVHLLRENIKHGSTLMIAQSAMSVFHTGIIGSGLRDTYIRTKLTTEQIKFNTQMLMNAVRSCCLLENETICIEVVTNVALLMVQLVSPDVMFNGLPWPEEEFCKVTVERDLHIRKIFNSTPLLWTLLRFVAMHRPALCTCSVLLRAITASLISQWSSASQGRQMKQDVQLLETSIELLEVLSLGQLLPPPLSGIRDIISYLQPHHVLLVFRECIWNYMRDHVPSPALFTRDNNGNMWRDPALSKPTKQYTETLRIIMLKNIDKLGDLYHQFFTRSNVETE